MKFKFSKKLKWLGIGAGLVLLTSAVAAPVLVSCSNDSGTTTPPSNDQNNGQNNNNGTDINAPVSSLNPSEYPNQEKAVGAINGSFNLGSVADTYGVKDSSSGEFSLNTAPGSSTNGNPNGAVSFRTATNIDKNGFAFNLVLNQPQKYVAFGQYDNYSGSGVSAIPKTNATEFLFGSAGLISSDWLSKNNLKAPDGTDPNAISWKIDTITQSAKLESDPDHTFELQLGTSSSSNMSSFFQNKKELTWNITDTSKDEQIIKTAYVILNLNLKDNNNKIVKIEIPINFNVIYNYKAQLSSTPFNLSTKAIKALSNTNKDGYYITEASANSSTPTWVDTDVANWQMDTLGSTETNNILNVRVSLENLAKIAILAPNTATLIGDNATETSLISKQWLIDAGFITESAPQTSGITFSYSTVSNNTGLTIGSGAKSYIGTTNNINWNQATSLSSLSSSSRAFKDYKYSQYISFPLVMTISKSGVQSRDIPFELRFVEPTTPFVTNNNVLKSDDSALLIDGQNANNKNGNLLSFVSSYNSADQSVNISFNAIMNINSLTKSFAFKQFTLSELINNGMINETWLKQAGFTSNAKISWSGYGNSIPSASIGDTTFNLETTQINGQNYFQVKNFNTYDWFVNTNISTSQTIKFGFEITISENGNEVRIPANVIATIPPFVAFEPSLTYVSQREQVYKSTEGYQVSAPEYTSGGNDAKIETPSNNESNGAYIDSRWGSVLNISVTKSAAKYFAFRLPNAQDLLGTDDSHTNAILNKELANSYGLFADVINSGVVTTEGTVASVKWSRVTEKWAGTGFEELKLTELDQSYLGSGVKEGTYIVNQVSLDNANLAASGDYQVPYTLTIEKKDGTTIILPITFTFQIK